MVKCGYFYGRIDQGTGKQYYAIKSISLSIRLFSPACLELVAGTVVFSKDPKTSLFSKTPSHTAKALLDQLRDKVPLFSPGSSQDQ